MGLVDAMDSVLDDWDGVIASMRTRVRLCELGERGTADVDVPSLPYFSGLFGGRVFLGWSFGFREGLRDDKGRRLPGSIPIA
jgi:hypothetical protein